MEEILINDKYQLSCPDGFHIMDEEETGRLNLLEGGSFIGLTDPGRHMIITVGWRKTGGFLSLMLKTKDLAVKMEKAIGQAMKSLGFRSEGHAERIIAGSMAEGFSYTYQAQDTSMFGQSYVLKEDKTVFYFHLYTREVLREENLPVWNGILDSVKKPGTLSF